jgi:hypothetical protein
MFMPSVAITTVIVVHNLYQRLKYFVQFAFIQEIVELLFCNFSPSNPQEQFICVQSQRPAFQCVGM